MEPLKVLTITDTISVKYFCRTDSLSSIVFSHNGKKYIEFTDYDKDRNKFYRIYMSLITSTGMLAILLVDGILCNYTITSNYIDDDDVRVRIIIDSFSRTYTLVFECDDVLKLSQFISHKCSKLIESILVFEPEYNAQSLNEFIKICSSRWKDYEIVVMCAKLPNHFKEVLSNVVSSLDLSGGCSSGLGPFDISLEQLEERLCHDMRIINPLVKIKEILEDDNIPIFIDRSSTGNRTKPAL